MKWIIQNESLGAKSQRNTSKIQRTLYSYFSTSTFQEMSFVLVEMKKAVFGV